jgi:hypothetical protein
MARPGVVASRLHDVRPRCLYSASFHVIARSNRERLMRTLRCTSSIASYAEPFSAPLPRLVESAYLSGFAIVGVGRDVQADDITILIPILDTVRQLRGV